jgi:hypothetical protein
MTFSIIIGFIFEFTFMALFTHIRNRYVRNYLEKKWKEKRR